MRAIKLVLASILLFSFLLTPARGQEERTIVDVLRIMFPGVTIEVEPITGTLIVKAPPLLHEKIEEIIEQLDVYHPQITIEAKFVELTVTDIHELGIELGITDIRVGPTLEEGAVDIISDWGTVDFPVETAAISIGLTRLDPVALSAVLRALEKRGKVNVLSAPRVTTLNRQPATIEITRTIPYVAEVETELVDDVLHITWTIEEEDAGIFLEVTPTVPEGSTLITLDIQPTVRELIEQIEIFYGLDIPPGLGWPIIDERTTNTTMIIDSGETVVLGGLIRDDTRVMERRVPLLGDIPLLGHLFRHEYSREEKKNLLIFITAYLLSPTGERIVARR